ncbi:MAG: class I SAM-dependent methyltransferase, partial [Anaerolineales bacterium]
MTAASPRAETHLPTESLPDFSGLRNLAEVKADPELAARIVRDLRPESVLDAQCGTGELVATLRARNVAAFGLNPSADVRELVRRFCQPGALIEPLPQRYDLIVCLEVLQYVSPENAAAAVANLCHHADDVLFSASPFPLPLESPANLQPPEYWAELFARQGFLRDMEFDFTAVYPWAILFRQVEQLLAEVVRAYEQRQWWLARENDQLHRINLTLRQQVAANTQAVQQAQTQLQSLTLLRAELRETQSSLGWRAAHITGRLFRRLAPVNTLRGHVVNSVHHLLARAINAYELFFDFALKHGWNQAVTRAGEVLMSALG